MYWSHFFLILQLPAVEYVQHYHVIKYRHLVFFVPFNKENAKCKRSIDVYVVSAFSDISDMFDRGAHPYIMAHNKK